MPRGVANRNQVVHVNLRVSSKRSSFPFENSATWDGRAISDARSLSAADSPQQPHCRFYYSLVFPKKDSRTAGARPQSCNPTPLISQLSIEEGQRFNATRTERRDACEVDQDLAVVNQLRYELQDICAQIVLRFLAEVMCLESDQCHIIQKRDGKALERPRPRISGFGDGASRSWRECTNGFARNSNISKILCRYFAMNMISQQVESKTNTVDSINNVT